MRKSRFILSPPLIAMAIVTLLGLALFIQTSLKIPLTTYRNTRFGYQFQFGSETKLAFISGKDSAELGQADTIGVDFDSERSIRIQVLPKPHKLVEAGISSETITLGKSAFATINAPMPCSHIVTGENNYLCIYISTEKPLLENEPDILQVLETLTFF